MQNQTAENQSAPQPRSTLRTLNVNQSVDGITDDIQVNVAYRHKAGLTYSEAKEFERQLQLKIQAVLNELSFGQPQPGAADPVRFISLDDAAKIAQRPSRKAFINWRWRHNAKHKNARIVLVNETVEINSLYRALEAHGGEATA